MKKAFTLAEVLITLGIIGVVAAMTLPSLIAKYQKRVMTNNLKKVYTELSQVVLLYKADMGVTDFKDLSFSSQDSANDFIKKYFKTAKFCGSLQHHCFAQVYTKLSGVKANFYCKSGAYALANGISVCVYVSNYRNIIMSLLVDVNGPKPPNIVGRDAFLLLLYSNGIIDDLILEDSTNTESSQWGTAMAPLTYEQREENFKASCLNSKPEWYHGCFGKILNDGWEMNY